MHLTTIKRNETDIHLLVKRLYPDLDDRKRKKVEKVLIKSNPHLLKAGALRPGNVVAIPSIPGIAPKPAAESEDPAEKMQSLLIELVTEYQKMAEEKMTAVLSEVEVQQNVLRDREVVRAIRQNEKTTGIAEKLKTSLDKRREVLSKEQGAQKELFPKIIEDLKAMSEW